MIDIREYWMDQSSEMKPGKKGNYGAILFYVFLSFHLDLLKSNKYLSVQVKCMCVLHFIIVPLVVLFHQLY